MSESFRPDMLWNDKPPLELRRKQLRNLRARGVDCYPARCNRTATIADGKLRLGGVTDRETLAGRILRIGNLGSSQTELTIGDETGQLRLLVDLSEEATRLLVDISRGDYIEASVTISTNAYKATDLRLITKTLRPIPEQPTTNWEALLAGIFPAKSIRIRSTLFRQVRQFLYDAGFLEIDTPIMTRRTDFDYLLRPFQSAFHSPDGGTDTVYLNLSPEYLMKRALVSGFEKFFQITRFFRDGDTSPIHNPEFQAVEWYEAYSDYNAVMQRIQELITLLAYNLTGSSEIYFREQKIDLRPPWPRMTVEEALRRFAQVECNSVSGDHAALCRLLEAGGAVNFNRNAPWETLFTKVVSEFVEPNLGRNQPTFLIDYPGHFEFGQMAKSTPNKTTVERFELYIAGLELCNGFSELNDPEEQERRFTKSAVIMDRSHPVPSEDRDSDFTQALEYGIPPSGGVALGLDRLLMVFLDGRSLDDVMLFPYQQLPGKPSRS